MNTLFKIILVFVIVVGLIAYMLLSEITDVHSADYKQIELVSKDKGKLYIKSQNWGVTGDNQLTIITIEDGKEFEIDSTQQIIFSGLEPFLYKTSNDTLFLILRQKAEIPINFKTGWTIIQNEVENSTMMKLRRNSEYQQI